MKSRAAGVGDLQALQQAVEESGLAGIVIATPENVRYAGDVAISTQRNIRHRPAYVLWPVNQDPVFVVAQNELARIRRGSWIERTSCYREFTSSPMEALAQAILDCGLAEAALGCELEYMPAAYVEELKRLLPRARIVACDDLLRRRRMIKTRAEIEILRHAAVATQRAIERTFAAAREGDGEFDLMRRLSDQLIASGAERIHSVHIYGGPNAGGPHMGPTARKLTAGDLVKADLCGVFDSYVSNVGRTAVVGEPSDDDGRAWARLYEIHRRVMDMVRPGARGSELYRAAEDLYAKAGFALGHPNNGHSIGLEVHERPQIGPREDLAYEPGMVTTVETRVRLSEERTLHIEDMLQVDEGGAIPLSDPSANRVLHIIPADGPTRT
jgi:Xaa-Pro aminopeptidase